MKQLVEFHTIPIDFGFRIHPAKFHSDMNAASVQVTRQPGSFQIRSKPAVLHLDTYDARYSLGLKSTTDLVRDFGKAGVRAAHEATANIVKEGNMLMDARNSNAFSQIAFQRMQSSLDTALAFLPSSPVQIRYEPGDLSIDAQMDRLQFDWRINNQPETTFEPARIEYYVEQYPKLQITYTGSPLYVPRSSSPEYNETPFNVLA